MYAITAPKTYSKVKPAGNPAPTSWVPLAPVETSSSW